MNYCHTGWGVALAVVVAMLPVTLRAWENDRESYEEDAGANTVLFFSPGNAIYGAGYGSGTWLRHTPVFGDYAARLYYNSIEEALYSGVGMTLRLMPRWTLAPFAGAGGNYNYSLAREIDDQDPLLPKRGATYWSGHVEAGFRLWIRQRSQFVDIACRQTWSSLKGDRDYLLLVFSFGAAAPQSTAWH